jgi:hypothetical protein
MAVWHSARSLSRLRFTETQVYPKGQSSSPIAWYVRGAAEHPASLAIVPDAKAMQDEILVAMLILRPRLALMNSPVNPENGELHPRFAT